MAGRELEAVQRAVDRYLAGSNLAESAGAEGISVATLHRGLNRRAVPKRGQLRRVPEDARRQTGRTTQQMVDAPVGAVFVWCDGHLGYPSVLAKTLGRDDLVLRPPPVVARCPQRDGPQPPRSGRGPRRAA